MTHPQALESLQVLVTEQVPHPMEVQSQVLVLVSVLLLSLVSVLPLRVRESSPAQTLRMLELDLALALAQCLLVLTSKPGESQPVLHPLTQELLLVLPAAQQWASAFVWHL